MTINVQDAARQAVEYYSRVSGDNMFNQRVTVEEVEMDERYWLITLGFSEQSFSINNPRNKDYKLFKVNKETGDIESMKIRTI